MNSIFYSFIDKPSVAYEWNTLENHAASWPGDCLHLIGNNSDFADRKSTRLNSSHRT